MPEEDDSRAASDQLVCAAEQYFEDMGWTKPDMPLTDLLIIAVRRGFDDGGGKSIATCIVPTETPYPTVLGMVRYADLWFSDLVVKSLNPEE